MLRAPPPKGSLRVDFQSTGAALHAARTTLAASSGFAETDVEKLAAAITKEVGSFLTTHEDQEVTLEQLTNAVDLKLRMAELIDPREHATRMDAIHDATEAATQAAMDQMNA